MKEHHVLGISGGKDSAALAVYMSLHHPELDIEYFFTDTGKELPEVYEFLGSLEGVLGKPIRRLDPHRDFDFWLKQYGHFLPSAQTRWCTRQLKLHPFKKWIGPWLAAGEKVYSYVAIRADEEHREGMIAQDKNLILKLPFREAGIDKQGVLEILEQSGIGLPKYYEWRSRSGCTFCFFQQKIEWVQLMRRHPESFQEAKSYEKSAVEHGSPFTWTPGESLEQLEQPDRIKEIEDDYRARLERELARRKVNPLRMPVRSGASQELWPAERCGEGELSVRRHFKIVPDQPLSDQIHLQGPLKLDQPIDNDDLYLEDEGGGACLICHK